MVSLLRPSYGPWTVIARGPTAAGCGRFAPVSCRWPLAPRQHGLSGARDSADRPRLPLRLRGRRARERLLDDVGRVRLRTRAMAAGLSDHAWSHNEWPTPLLPCVRRKN